MAAEVDRVTATTSANALPNDSPSLSPSVEAQVPTSATQAPRGVRDSLSSRDPRSDSRRSRSTSAQFSSEFLRRELIASITFAYGAESEGGGIISYQRDSSIRYQLKALGKDRLLLQKIGPRASSGRFGGPHSEELVQAVAAAGGAVSGAVRSPTPSSSFNARQRYPSPGFRSRSASSSMVTSRVARSVSPRNYFSNTEPEDRLAHFLAGNILRRRAGGSKKRQVCILLYCIV